MKMDTKKKRGFTVVQNELLSSSQLSIQARYLFLVMLKHSGQNDSCYPSQELLGQTLMCTPRHIRNLLKELRESGLIVWTRSGFNKPNTYQIAKSYTWEPDGKFNSYQLGNKFPFHQGSMVPTKSTYRKPQENKRWNDGMKRIEKNMIENRIPNMKK